MELTLTETKVVVLVLLGLVKLFSGLAPLLATKLFKKRSDFWFKRFIGIVLCFGGGVLLSTVLIHMMKEVRELLERATTAGIIPKDVKYPFAELLLCIGFLFILLIESVVDGIFGGEGHSHFPSGQSEEEVPALSPQPDLPVPVPDCADILTTGPTTSPFCNNNCTTGERESETDALAAEPECPVIANFNKENRKKKVATFLTSFVVVLALSIHSVFEGMAIGLEEKEAGVWKLFLAVAIHATAIIFCIGTEMIADNTQTSLIVIYMVVLSLVTPIGVVIGIIVTEHMEQASGEHVLAIGVLQGLAAGSLLYITFCEVLTRENLGKYGMSRMVGAMAVLVGFTFMAAMEAGAQGHGHGGPSEETSLCE